MRAYKCLHTNEFSEGAYLLTPIRHEDRFEIMRWRNEQLDILRQQKPLTITQQEIYFGTVITDLFGTDKPSQLLWSFLENGRLIGYGGLVHINWEKKTGEISFLTETSRNKSNEEFIADWKIYLSILKKIAAEQLKFNFIFTYAYDIRPNLYIALEQSGFEETQRLPKHTEINGELKDVVIHKWYCSNLKMRLANTTDADIYYNWANDELVRKNSYQSNEINYQEHITWFNQKIKSGSCFFYIFETEAGNPVGQVRIDSSNNEVIIGVSVDKDFRGKGIAAEMIERASENYMNHSKKATITAYIKKENTASIKQFQKAGFIIENEVVISGIPSFRLLKKEI